MKSSDLWNQYLALEPLEMFSDVGDVLLETYCWRRFLRRKKENARMKWKTKDGKEIDISEMETSHIKNALNMLQRKGFVSPRDVEFYLFGPEPDGDGAYEAYTREQYFVFNAPCTHFINDFEDELQRRKVNNARSSADEIKE